MSEEGWLGNERRGSDFYNRRPQALGDKEKGQATGNAIRVVANQAPFPAHPRQSTKHTITPQPPCALRSDTNTQITPIQAKRRTEEEEGVGSLAVAAELLADVVCQGQRAAAICGAW